VLAADFNTMVQQQVVATFANAAARTAAISAPVPGMVTYRADANMHEFWTGTAWLPIQPIYNDSNVVGVARIRAGSRVGATDVGGLLTLSLSPPLGAPITWMANVGENTTAVIFKPVQPGFVTGATSVSFIAVRTSNDTPLASTVVRMNWLIIDRFT
jgi:hypothetical protein